MTRKVSVEIYYDSESVGQFIEDPTFTKLFISKSKTERANTRGSIQLEIPDQNFEVTREQLDLLLATGLDHVGALTSVGREKLLGRFLKGLE